MVDIPRLTGSADTTDEHKLIVFFAVILTDITTGDEKRICLYVLKMPCQTTGRQYV